MEILVKHVDVGTKNIFLSCVLCLQQVKYERSLPVWQTTGGKHTKEQLSEQQDTENVGAQ